MWKKSIKLGVGAFLFSFGLGSALSAAPIKVVSSFSILADLVQQVGGTNVQSVSIIGPESDAHAFEPRPSDAKVLQQADLLVMNGAHFEAWLPKLMASAGYQGPVLEATKGIALRSYHETIAADAATHDDHHDEHDGHAHGDDDPHAWQNLAYAQIYVQNIRDALIAIDEENKDQYSERAAIYTQQLSALQQQLASRFQGLAAEQRTVISTHDAFAYLGQAYDITFLALLGASTQAEPSAKELAQLVQYMRDHKVRAVFMEKGSSPKLVEQIARETKAQVGRPLYADTLAKAPHQADSYLGMMQWNADAILEALSTP